MNKQLDASKHRTFLKDTCDKWFKESLSKGDRGRLRRAGQVESLAANEAMFNLEKRLQSVAKNVDDIGILALAALLAGLKADSNNVLIPAKELATRAGAKGDSDKPKLSRARLGKLFAAQDINKRLRAFRELLRILDNTADAGDLAECFLYWHEPKTRWRFARAYFNPISVAANDASNDDSADAAQSAP